MLAKNNTLKSCRRPRVEAPNDTLLPHEARGDGREIRAVGGIRHGADARGLKRAEEAVRDELSTSCSTEVDGRLVLVGLFLTHHLCSVDFEQLHPTELEPALDGVANSSRSKAG